MTPALRLVVAWVLGAVATVAAYRAPQLREDEPIDAINRYLQTRYDEIEYLDDGYRASMLAYVPVETSLAEVHDDVLRRFLPDTRFFTTTLAGPSEYQHIELLVSFRRASGRDDIRTCVSRAFRRPSPKFLWQFLGLSAPTPESRRELAAAVTELLAKAASRDVVDLESDWKGRVHRITVTDPITGKIDAYVSAV